MLGELEANNSSSADMESRKRCLTSPGTVKKPGDVCATPPAKKLKQARLPFQPLSSPPVTQICSPSPKPLSKKRKLSETDTNLSSPQQSTKLKDKTSVTPSNKKSVTKPSSKRTPGKPRLVKEPDPPVVEIEVSSSSEDVVAAAAAKSPSKKKLKPLDRFLQANQEPTSTSDEEVIDLAVDGSEDKKDEGASKCENKEEKSSSDDKEVKVIEDSKDDCKDLAKSKDEDCDVSLVSDGEASAAESSVLDSSTASEASCNTSVDSDASPEVTNADTKPADSMSEVSSVSASTPKSVSKPPNKTPLSAKAKQKEKERELKRLEKEKIKEEKKQKVEKEKEEKRKQKEAAKAEKEAKAAEAKRLKELEKEQKAEAKRLKELEKEQKAEAKRLKDLEKEQKLKEKQTKLEQEENEKLEKQKLKIKELELKNEEKKLKMEEKQKVEEEKKKEEEMKRKAKEKQQNMFKSFFKKIETPVTPKQPKQERCGGFVPFQLQKDMALAPVYGFDKLQEEDTKERFDNLVKSQDTRHLYLNQLKAKEIKKGKRTRTRVKKDTINENSEDSVQMVEDITEAKKKTKTKAKLLQFHDNHRPAYYGTWSKISIKVSARNFMKKDEDFLDYEFDSDEEWEEPGESLSDSEGEDNDSDNDSNGDDSDNDGFFVEHGYLSESEDPLDEDESIEQWTARRKAKAEAWEIEKKRQTYVLKPIIVGCVWLHGAEKNQSRFDQTKLEAFRAVALVTVPIESTLSARKSPETIENDERSPTPNAVISKSQQKMPVPEEAMSALVRLVHGNPIGIKSLCREFREYWRLQELKRSGTPEPSVSTTTKSEESPASKRSESPKPTPPADGEVVTAASTPSGNSLTDAQKTETEAKSTDSTPEEVEKVYTISKRQLEKKIAIIAVREKRSKCYARVCWYVHNEILEKYKLIDLPVPTQWEHQTGPLAVNRSDDAPIPYSLLPPQVVTSTPSSSARRIIPTKVSSSPSSVLSMLQQQKTKVVTNHAAPMVVDRSSAAGMLATAAALCSAPQAGNPVLVKNTTSTVTRPISPIPCVKLVPLTQQQVVAATHNAPVLTAANQPQITPVPEKPSKKVRTLDSFFGGKPKKASSQKDAKINATDIHTTIAMDITESNSTKVSDSATTKLPVEENTLENKMEVDAPDTTVVTSEQNKKTTELGVIKDLLSQAKENRLKKQSSPLRKKSPLKVIEATSTVGDSTVSAVNKTNDDPDVITLD